jgi:hypothetical protein
MLVRSHRIWVNVVAAVLAVATFPVAVKAQDRPLPTDVGPVNGGGAFVMQSCGETGASLGWATTLNTNDDALATGVDCPPSSRPPGYPTSFQQAGLWASDRLGDAGGVLEADSGDRAEVTFLPLPDTTITRLRYWRAIHKLADPGDRWQPYISLSTRSNVIDTCVIGGQSTCFAGGDDWFPNDATTTNRSSYRDLSGLSASSIIVGLYCGDSDVHTCGNGSTLTHVDAEIFSAFLTISDPDPPTIGTPTGDGWTADTWSQGTLPLALASSDITGISATRVYADGSLIATLQRSCSYDRPRPCTDESSGTVGLPTAGGRCAPDRGQRGRRRRQRDADGADGVAPHRQQPTGRARRPGLTRTVVNREPLRSALVAARRCGLADRRRALPGVPGRDVPRTTDGVVAHRCRRPCPAR